MISPAGNQETIPSIQAQFEQLSERVSRVLEERAHLKNDLLVLQKRLVPGSNDHYSYSDRVAALLEDLTGRKSALEKAEGENKQKPVPLPQIKPPLGIAVLPDPVVGQAIASFLPRADLYRFLRASKNQQSQVEAALRVGFLKAKLPDNDHLLLPLHLIDFHLRNYGKLNRLEQDPYIEKDPVLFQGVLEGDLNQEHLEKAARVGNIRLVQWLVAAERGLRRLRASGDTLLAATKSNLALVKWLVAEDRGDRRLRANKSMLNTAAVLGNLDMVQWLLAVERGNRMAEEEEEMLLAPDTRLLADQETLSLAAKSGNLALVQWLLALEQGDPRLKVGDRPLLANEYTLQAAAKSGNLALVQWLVAEARGNRRLMLEEYVLQGAAQSGNLDLVQWLMAEERAERRLRATGATLWMAALSGNLALVQWLVVKNPSLLDARDGGMLERAADSGNLALVQWLTADERGDKRLVANQATLQAAAHSDNLALVQWLMADERGERRLTAHEDTLYIAAASGNLDMVQWLAATGERGERRLEVTFDMLLAAAKFGYRTIAEWMLRWLVAAERGERRLIITPENIHIQEIIWPANTLGHKRVAQWLESQLAAPTLSSPTTVAVASASLGGRS